MNPLLKLFDRTAVLFVGVAAGAAIGYAFAPEAEVPPPPPVRKEAPAPAKPVVAAVAQPIGGAECAVRFQPGLMSAVAEQRPIRVGVFGDSFGDGLWAALYRQLPAKDGFEVVKFSQQSTGFTRYASMNVEEHDAGRLVGDPVDIAVVSFGANDTQGVMHKGKYAELMSPEWQEEIGARIDRYVRMLRDQGAVVYWVGLPRMRKASFDADIQAMNGFFARRMERLGVPFTDAVPLVADEAGAYAAYLNDPKTGKKTLIRANDGIHMSMTGYGWITGGLAGRIRDYIAAARAMAAAEGAGAPA